MTAAAPDRTDRVDGVVISAGLGLAATSAWRAIASGAAAAAANDWETAFARLDALRAIERVSTNPRLIALARDGRLRMAQAMSDVARVEGAQ